MRDGVLAPLGQQRCYRYIGPQFRLRSFTELSLYKTVICGTLRLRNYPGLFIREHRGKRRREILEPPEKLVRRLGLGVAP